MTADQIKIFVYRLLNRDVSTVELAELSVRDLTDVNVYLLEHRNVLELRKRNFPGFEHFVTGSLKANKIPQITYSEEEILAELGMAA